MALLRAAVGSLVDACDEWPELADATQCRVWLSDRWTEPDLVDAIRQASTSLADRVDAICAGEVTGDRQIRRAATAVARYVLRATGRPTPFGLFAGVAPVSLGGSGSVRWGEDHRPLARVNTEWLADVVGRDCDRLRDVLAYLVRLTEPLPVVGETLPGWWTSHGPDDRPSADWPGGHANLGMAHGIAGPLALLALAYRRGITVREHADAIQRICDWLDQWHCETVSSSWWPGVITAADWEAGGLLQHGPQRPSWCYGTPGLARAQQLAGQALDDASRKRVAEYALASCVADEMQLSLLRDASLCHGWAGLIQTTWRIAHDADPDSPLAALLPKLRIRMDHHLQRHGPPPGDGLLEGMVGICLSRRTVEADAAPVSHWDTCLLLDD